MTATFPADACQEQVDLFRKIFPNGAPMTVETAVAVADQFDWGLIAGRLLKGTHLATYQAAMAPIYATYKAARAPIYATYDAAMAQIDATYDAAMAQIDATYDAAMARAFAEAYLSQVAA